MIDKMDIWRICQRIFVIISWGFIGWLIGSLVGGYLFGEIGEKILGIIGIIPGGLWGLKSNWLIC
jgi:hypothetical protein